MKAAGRWRRVLLADSNEHHQSTLIQTPVRFLQIVPTRQVEDALKLAEQSPFDVFLLATDLLSQTTLPQLQWLRERQPVLHIWLLCGETSPESLCRSASPEKVFHWPVSITDLQLALRTTFPI